MKKYLTAGFAAAAIGVGTLGIGSLLPASAVQVDDGTTDTTEAPAEADEGPVGRHGPRGEARQERRAETLATVAEVLGTDVESLQEQLGPETSIADIAGDQTDEVIDALMAQAEENLAERVADGDLDQDRADQIAEGLEERITGLVNGERPERGHRGPGCDDEDAPADEVDEPVEDDATGS